MYITEIETLSEAINEIAEKTRNKTEKPALYMTFTPETKTETIEFDDRLRLIYQSKFLDIVRNAMYDFSGNNESLKNLKGTAFEVLGDNHSSYNEDVVDGCEEMLNTYNFIVKSTSQGISKSIIDEQGLEIGVQLAIIFTVDRTDNVNRMEFVDLKKTIEDMLSMNF